MDRPILLTGATGLLGTWLRRTAPRDVSITALTHRTPLDDAAAASVAADLRDPAATAAAVAEARPSTIVHAAYAHDGASIVDATRSIVAAASASGADVLFISTDAVFSGDGRPRAETDAPDPVWDYGRWKARAEELVTAGAARSTIIRLPLLTSIEPDDHVTARIRADGDEGRPMRWFDDELRQPAVVSEVAAAIWTILALDAAARSGVWHLPGPEVLSRYDIADRVARTIGLDPALVRPEPTPPGANRPRSLHLSDRRTHTAIGWSPSPVFPVS